VIRKNIRIALSTHIPVLRLNIEYL